MTGLKVEVGGDLAPFEKTMARAKEVAARSAIDIAAKFSTAATTINASFRALSLASAVARNVGPIAAVALGYKALTTAIDHAAAATERYITIANGAARAGVSTSFFQAFTAQARELRLETESLEKALASAQNAVRDRHGQPSEIGAQLSKLQEEGFTGGRKLAAQDRFETAPNNEGRILATLAAMQELEKIGNRLAAIDLGERLFGRGSEIVERYRAGLLDLAELQQRLANPTNIVSEADIERARELKQRLEDAKREIDEALAISVSLAEAGYAIQRAWLAVVEAVASAAKGMSGFLAEARAAGEAQAKLLDARAAAQRRDSADAAESEAARYDGASASVVQAQAARRAARRRGEVAEANMILDPSEAAREHNRAVGRSRLPDPNAPIGARTTGEMFGPPIPTATARARGGSGGGGSTGLDDIERFINALEKSNSTLTVELNTLGRSNVERERGIALARLHAEAKEAGRTATDQEVDAVTRLAEANANLKSRIKDVEQAQRLAAETMRHFGDLASDALGDIIFDGQKAEDVLRRLASSIGRSALQAALTGQGPLAGLLGTAPAASGGPNAAGGLFGALFRGFSGAGDTTLPATAPLPPVRPSVFHGGGRVGGPAPTRAVDPSVFSHASYYQSGKLGRLSSNERAAILHLDETVLTKRQSRGLGAMAGALSSMQGGGGQTVNIQPPAGYEAQQEQRSTGQGESLDVTFQKIVQADLHNNGLIARTMQGMYGMSRIRGR